MAFDTPTRILSDEVGPVKAAIILAALRAQGWEVVRKNPLIDDWAEYHREKWKAELRAAYT